MLQHCFVYWQPGGRGAAIFDVTHQPGSADVSGFYLRRIKAAGPQNFRIVYNNNSLHLSKTAGLSVIGWIIGSISGLPRQTSDAVLPLVFTDSERGCYTC